MLVKAGVTGVLNVQTHGDLRFRGVNQELMMKTYAEKGIKAVHFPIEDFSQDELMSKLFEGAKTLNNLINLDRPVKGSVAFADIYPVNFVTNAKTQSGVI